MTKIDIAVCMATYNGQKYIHDQISSILDQLSSHEVLFISDDASSDDTIKIIRGFGDKVFLVDSSRAGGVVKNFERTLAAAYNFGAKAFVLVDQDDVWIPGRMIVIRNCLKDSDIVVTNGYITDSNLLQSGYSIFEKVKFRRGFLANLIRPSYLGCCMAFNRSVLDIALPFPRYITWHDWFISLIAELYFSIAVISTPFIHYRRHNENHSNTGDVSKNSFFKKIKIRLLMIVSITTVIKRRHLPFL